MGRVVAQKCAETLLPLREEARQHNNLSAAVSTLLTGAQKGAGSRHQTPHSALRTACVEG